ncbi:C45 family peptidase [Bacillus sp. FJAT-50079]|uniref:C45 family autoproteolytic acyltransferase/hydolase n=1 Tax=Bacillus sp. FJAT-50079 TaxID=2833577 RepID=UPI001BCA1B07|nr:C45 family peptidase [Bacillus sp. FJAT-50079]MBS4209491.1 linear amide C-N hydrolase [Bacillus sp. FJAT-50079]
MKQIYSDIIQFRGDHYDFGFMQGEQIKDSLTLENRERIWKLRKPKFTVDEKETKQVFMTFAPAIWAEIEGLRDALKWPMQDILRDFGGYRIPIERSGCSIFTGKDFMVRNYDFHPKTYEGRFSIFQPTDTGYASIGPAQRIIGRMDGMNEKGLAMGYNSMHRKQPGVGFVCWMIGRMILENCANVKEAIALLNEIPHRHSFSYIVLDPNEETYVIETSPRAVAIRQSNACTNHFEIMTEENRRHLVDSHKRLDAILEQKDNATNAYAAFRMLNDKDKHVFSNEYKSWAGTIHTSVYLPKEKQAWMALGGDQEPVKFDFSKWLQGEDIRVTRIYGEVDTELGFAHMDKGLR